MDVDPKREIPPARPSLMDLSIAMSPWTQIRQIRLLRSQIESKSIDIAEPSQVNTSFDATTVFNREDGTLRVHASLMVSVGEFVQIIADFALEYGVDKTMIFTDEVAAAFGRLNGIYNVWPYWREYVQSTVARLGLPPLTLPLMTGASLLAYFTEKDKSSDSLHVAQLQQESGPRLGGAAVL